MKKIVLFIVLSLTFSISRGQNLVPNHSFELYSGCPTYYTQIDCVLFWMNPMVWPGPGGSPDYFNTCATPSSFVDVPDNIFGYQQAHSGDAYCGITLWDMNNLFREYIQVPLTSTLAPGCYQFEMYVNLANKYKYTASPVGVYFSSTPITGVPNFLPLPYTPQINITGFTTDTLNWTLLTGNYTAQGNENYLIIGNYNNNAGTVSSFVNSAGVYDQSYIFIDDVSLIMCGTSTVNEHDENNMFDIYPNPVTDNQLQIISVNSRVGGGKFEMFDINGRKVYSVNVLRWDSEIIELPELDQGVYHAVITDSDYRLVKRIAIITD